MHLVNMADNIASAFNGRLNGQTVRVYKGTPPATANDYLEASHSTDLLASGTISTYVLLSTKLSTVGTLTYTPIATGAASWFVIENVAGTEVLMSDVSDINGSGTLIMSTVDLVLGVDFIIEDLELNFIQLAGV